MTSVQKLYEAKLQRRDNDKFHVQNIQRDLAEFQDYPFRCFAQFCESHSDHDDQLEWVHDDEPSIIDDLGDRSFPICRRCGLLAVWPRARWEPFFNLLETCEQMHYDGRANIDPVDAIDYIPTIHERDIDQQIGNFIKRHLPTILLRDARYPLAWFSTVDTNIYETSDPLEILVWVTVEASATWSVPARHLKRIQSAEKVNVRIIMPVTAWQSPFGDIKWVYSFNMSKLESHSGDPSDASITSVSLLWQVGSE